jgi:hypothetical protein
LDTEQAVHFGRCDGLVWKAGVAIYGGSMIGSYRCDGVSGGADTVSVWKCLRTLEMRVHLSVVLGFLA